MSVFEVFSEMVAEELGLSLERSSCNSQYYAGIGSRETPYVILREMTKLASILEKKGYTLRSGGAIGADDAFALGTQIAEIWLPKKSSAEKNLNHSYKVIDYNDIDAFNSIEKYHPAPTRLTPDGKLLMARNYRQIVGIDSPDSKFVVCWTKDGGATGGTGQAIRIARDLEIPVFNYYNMSTNQIIREIIKLEHLL